MANADAGAEGLGVLFGTCTPWVWGARFGYIQKWLSDRKWRRFDDQTIREKRLCNTPSLFNGLQGERMGRPLLWLDLGAFLFPENPQIRPTSFCAGSLGRAPNRTQFTNSKTKTLFKDIDVSYTILFYSNWHLHVSYVIADCSAIARSRAHCTAAARKHNTTPP